ncbi:MAG: response regulator transcription factor [Bacteroidota bacterium]
MHILLVEDETKLARFIQRGLETEGFTVEIAADGALGEKRARSDQFDLILLDVLLPKKDGLEILKAIRKAGIKTPVLMLTARSETQDIVSGLDTGADDYLTKPFVFEVLLARIRSILRRGHQSETLLKIADLRLDTVKHKASRNGTTIDLTAREYALLECLMRNHPKLVTRQHLAKEIWGFDFDPGTNIVDVYVNHLRKKIDHGFGKKLLHTERGQGYYIAGEEKQRKKR